MSSARSPPCDARSDHVDSSCSCTCPLCLTCSARLIRLVYPLLKVDDTKAERCVTVAVGSGVLRKLGCSSLSSFRLFSWGVLDMAPWLPHAASRLQYCINACKILPHADQHKRYFSEGHLGFNNDRRQCTLLQCRVQAHYDIRYLLQHCRCSGSYPSRTIYCTDFTPAPPHKVSRTRPDKPQRQAQGQVQSGL